MISKFTPVLSKNVPLWFLFKLVIYKFVNKTYLILALMISPLFLSSAFGHQADSVGDYRIEIDWKNKPIVTGESNAIIVYVSEMDKSKEAADQPFVAEKGIEGLKKTLKIQLVVDTESITLPLQPTDVPGKYESSVTPTFSGWSQLNFLGKINDTRVNLALHPLKVEEPEILHFPPVESITVEIGDFEREINDLRGDIRALENTIIEMKEQSETKNSFGNEIIITAIGLGIAGIAIGTASFVKKK